MQLIKGTRGGALRTHPQSPGECEQGAAVIDKVSISSASEKGAKKTNNNNNNPPTTSGKAVEEPRKRRRRRRRECSQVAPAPARRRPRCSNSPSTPTGRLIKYLTDLLLRLFNLFIMASSQGGFKETLQPLNYNRSDSIYIPMAMGRKSSKAHIA